MKKALLLLTIVLVSVSAISQNRKYRKSMRQSIEVMNEASDRTASLKCADKFDEITQAYPDQWIPYYYASQILTNISFEDQDTEQGDATLDRAQVMLDGALALAPSESELHVLQAWLLLSRITIDPSSRGQLYFEDVNYAMGKAKELNPDNPRTYLLQAMLTLNLPEFMGGGPLAAKPIFLEADKKFKAFQNDDPLWPNWGEDMNVRELENLKQ